MFQQQFNRNNRPKYSNHRPQNVENFAEDHMVNTFCNNENVRPSQHYQQNVFLHGANNYNFNQNFVHNHQASNLNINHLQRDYDADYDRSVSKLIDEIDKDLLNGKYINDMINNELDNKENQISNGFQMYDLEDDEDPDADVCDVDEKIEPWYQTNLKKKEENVKHLLKTLSNNVSACSVAKEHMERLKEDHNVDFCKMDPTRHRPLKYPWVNYWKFTCKKQCSYRNPARNHVTHSPKCETYILLDKTDEKTKFVIHAYDQSINKKRCLYPDIVISIGKEFLSLINRTIDKRDEEEDRVNQMQWESLQIKCNKNAFMLIATCRNVFKVSDLLRKHFTKEKRDNLKISSIYYISLRGQTKAANVLATHVVGGTNIVDKIGSVKLDYNPNKKILNNINTLEIELLGKTIVNYLDLDANTILLHIGCDLGILSAMLANKCSKVIGITTADGEENMANEIRKYNELKNATYFKRKITEIDQMSTFLKNERSVVLIRQDSVYGKSPDTILKIRALPSVWKVVMYGGFKDYSKPINYLVRSAQFAHAGPAFLPNAGCIVDRSPYDVDDYYVVLSFQRKSLIEPKEIFNFKEDKPKVNEPKVRKGITVRQDLMNNRINGLDSNVIYDDRGCDNNVEYEEAQENATQVEQTNFDRSVVYNESPVAVNPMSQQRSENQRPVKTEDYGELENEIDNRYSGNRYNTGLDLNIGNFSYQSPQFSTSFQNSSPEIGVENPQSSTQLSSVKIKEENDEKKFISVKSEPVDFCETDLSGNEDTNVQLNPFRVPDLPSKIKGETSTSGSDPGVSLKQEEDKKSDSIIDAFCELETPIIDPYKKGNLNQSATISEHGFTIKTDHSHINTCLNTAMENVGRFDVHPPVKEELEEGEVNEQDDDLRDLLNRKKYIEQELKLQKQYQRNSQKHKDHETRNERSRAYKDKNPFYPQSKIKSENSPKRRRSRSRSVSPSGSRYRSPGSRYRSPDSRCRSPSNHYRSPDSRYRSQGRYKSPRRRRSPSRSPRRSPSRYSRKTQKRSSSRSSRISRQRSRSPRSSSSSPSRPYNSFNKSSRRISSDHRKGTSYEDFNIPVGKNLWSEKSPEGSSSSGRSYR